MRSIFSSSPEKIRLIAPSERLQKNKPVLERGSTIFVQPGTRFEPSTIFLSDLRIFAGNSKSRVPVSNQKLDHIRVLKSIHATGSSILRDASPF